MHYIRREYTTLQLGNGRKKRKLIYTIRTLFFYLVNGLYGLHITHIFEILIKVIAQ